MQFVYEDGETDELRAACEDPTNSLATAWNDNAAVKACLWLASREYYV